MYHGMMCAISMCMCLLNAYLGDNLYLNIIALPTSPPDTTPPYRNPKRAKMARNATAIRGSGPNMVHLCYHGISNCVLSECSTLMVNFPYDKFAYPNQTIGKKSVVPFKGLDFGQDNPQHFHVQPPAG